MIDAVLSYHLNGATCGVAKFNQQLAQKLGVPCCSFGSVEALDAEYPLVSIKPEEMPRGIVLASRNQPFDLFLHGPSDGPPLQRAMRVYAANGVIAAAVRPLRPDVIEAFCPSTLQGNPTRAALNVLTFGMAHKLQLPYYEKLKTLLDGSGQDYTVSVSTAVHEGSPWDAVSEAGEKLRAIFKDKTRVLGYLADDALAKELQDCSAVAMFFDPALRANNTTYWAAREAGHPIITNLDADSPETPGLGHYNINALTTWPTLLTIGPPHTHTWDRLLQTLGVSVAV